MKFMSDILHSHLTLLTLPGRHRQLCTILQTRGDCHLWQRPQPPQQNDGSNLHLFNQQLHSPEIQSGHQPRHIHRHTWLTLPIQLTLIPIIFLMTMPRPWVIKATRRCMKKSLGSTLALPHPTTATLELPMFPHLGLSHPHRFLRFPLKNQPSKRSGNVPMLHNSKSSTKLIIEPPSHLRRNVLLWQKCWICRLEAYKFGDHFWSLTLYDSLLMVSN